MENRSFLRRHPPNSTHNSDQGVFFFLCLKDENSCLGLCLENIKAGITVCILFYQKLAMTTEEVWSGEVEP